AESDSVSVIDTNTNTVLRTIKVGTEPWGSAYDADHYRLYVSNNDSDSVSVIDTASNVVVATMPTGAYPLNPEFDPGLGRLYVTNCESNDVSVLKIRTEFPPAAPQALRITKAAGSSATLAWGVPAWAGSSKVSGYQVKATPGNRSCKTTTRRSCTITGLRAGTRYVFEVRAVNRYGPGTPATTNPASW
ncbi:MAG: fibronectin type III domain-containing protein, partial [Actinomycetales bacterium]